MKSKIDSRAILLSIRENRSKLNSCPRHKFDISAVEWSALRIGQELVCKRCGGNMQARMAFEYTNGYEAAGGDPNDIIEGFRSGNEADSLENTVRCPKCGGIGGYEVEKDDWFDCELCDATGTAQRTKALKWIDEHEK